MSQLEIIHSVFFFRFSQRLVLEGELVRKRTQPKKTLLVQPCRKMRSMASCTIKGAEGMQDILGEKSTALDHRLKNLTATFIAISPSGRPEQGSTCPKCDLFSSKFNSGFNKKLLPLSTNVSCFKI